MKKLLLTSVIVFAAIINSSAQDDLMKVLKENQTVKPEKVIATFKTTKLINIQTNETVHKRVLDFRIAHRFGSVGSQYNGGFHNFYGLYSINDVRFAFEYGITDKLAIGVSRSKVNENFEGLIKYRIMQQTSDNKIPVSLTVFGNTAVSAVKDISESKVYDVFARRIAYSTQLSIAHKFTSSFSLTLNPMYVHRNYVSNPEDFNDGFALGAGFRFKFTRSMSIVGDYIYNFNSFTRKQTSTLTNGNAESYWDPIGLGIEIETGGHVFTIMFSNTTYLLESEMLSHASENPAKGGIKFSFNISRNFSM
ncbi:MAG: DUF5777 family beta-barrel protein [Bacteroidia bacterium]